MARTMKEPIPPQPAELPALDELCALFSILHDGASDRTVIDAEKRGAAEFTLSTREGVC